MPRASASAASSRQPGWNAAKPNTVSLRERARQVRQRQDAAEHLVRAEGMRDLVRAENLQRRRRLEGVQHMDRHTGSEEGEQAGHAKGAAERQHGQQ